MDRYQKEKPVFCSAFNPLIPLISCVELRATISVLGTLIPNPKIQIWSEKKKKKKLILSSLPPIFISRQLQRWKVEEAPTI